MKLGVLGGSGLYALEGLQDVREICLDTPFGTPSDAYVQGGLGETDVVFLPRHGRGHRLAPSEINHRANIHGLKQLGVTRVISVSAVGSLKEGLRPRDIVLPDQYFDRTKRGAEAQTFFGEGVVAHVGFGDPTCLTLGDLCEAVCRQAATGPEASEGVQVHRGGTYVNMEGPAFSTRAESNVYRTCGFDVIGMTGLFEAKLCREAELCYQPISMVTDYDCWHESEEDVSVAMLLEHLHANTRLAKVVIRGVAAGLSELGECACSRALAMSIVTAREAIPAEARARLELLIGRYL